MENKNLILLSIIIIIIVILFLVYWFVIKNDDDEDQVIRTTPPTTQTTPTTSPRPVGGVNGMFRQENIIESFTNTESSECSQFNVYNGGLDGLEENLNGIFIYNDTLRNFIIEINQHYEINGNLDNYTPPSNIDTIIEEIERYIQKINCNTPNIVMYFFKNFFNLNNNYDSCNFENQEEKCIHWCDNIGDVSNDPREKVRGFAEAYCDGNDVNNLRNFLNNCFSDNYFGEKYIKSLMNNILNDDVKEYLTNFDTYKEDKTFREIEDEIELLIDDINLFNEIKEILFFLYTLGLCLIDKDYRGQDGLYSIRYSHNGENYNIPIYEIVTVNIEDKDYLVFKKFSSELLSSDIKSIEQGLNSHFYTGRFHGLLLITSIYNMMANYTNRFGDLNVNKIDCI